MTKKMPLTNSKSRRQGKGKNNNKGDLFITRIAIWLIVRAHSVPCDRWRVGETRLTGVTYKTLVSGFAEDNYSVVGARQVDVCKERCQKVIAIKGRAVGSGTVQHPCGGFEGASMKGVEQC